MSYHNLYLCVWTILYHDECGLWLCLRLSFSPHSFIHSLLHYLFKLWIWSTWWLYFGQWFVYICCALIFDPLTKFPLFQFVCLISQNFTPSCHHAFKNKNCFNEKKTCARPRIFFKIWICNAFDMWFCSFILLLFSSSFDVLHIHNVVVLLIKHVHTYDRELLRGA